MNSIRIPVASAIVVVLAAGAVNSADTPEKPVSYQTTGDLVGKITKVDDKSITITVNYTTRTGSGRSGRTVQRQQNYAMSFTPDAHARIQHLPPKLDDNGKKVSYTADELRKLKGTHSNLPGYEVELSQLKVGQMVEAHVVHSSSKDSENLVRRVMILDNGQQNGQQNNNKPNNTNPQKQ